MVKTARRKNPFVVLPMSQEGFYDLWSVRGCRIQRKETDEREKVSFSKAAVLEVTRPLKTNVKKTHVALQSFQTLNHAPRGGRRPSFQNAIIRPKYDGPVPVSPAKHVWKHIFDASIGLSGARSIAKLTSQWAAKT